MLICPACLGELRSESYGDGALPYWHCERCGGLAIPPALLRKLHGDDFHHALIGSAKDASGPSRLPCPICSCYLREIEIGGGSDPLKIGFCLSCQTTWGRPETARMLAGSFGISPPGTTTLHSQTLTVPAPIPAPPPVPPPEALREQAAAATGGAPAGKPVYSAEQQEKLASLYAGTVAGRFQADENPNVPEKWWQKALAFLGVPVVVREEELARTPYATWTMVALIVAFSLAAFRADLETVVRNLGFLPAAPLRAFGMTFLTSFLMHGDLFHLLGNLYFLVIFGMYVEERLGGWFFVALLAASSLAGDVLHAAMAPDPMTPPIGASGGIAGLITFFCLSFPKAKVIVFFFFRWLRFSAWFWVLLWVGQQLLGAGMQVTGAGNVSYLCHVGGALTGVVFWLAWTYVGRDEGAKK